MQRHIVDDVTLMLRALHDELTEMQGRQASRQEIDRIFASHMSEITRLAAGASADQIAAIQRMTAQFAGNQEQLMRAMADLRKMMVARKRTPERENPLREYTKDGVIERIDARHRLFFPFRDTALAAPPAGTCVLRDGDTLDVLFAGEMVRALLDLPATDERRALLAHPLLPIGDLGIDGAPRSIDELYELVHPTEGAGRLRQRLKDVLARHNLMPATVRVAPMPAAAAQTGASDEALLAFDADVSSRLLRPLDGPRDGRYFNATLALLAAHRFWSTKEAPFLDAAGGWDPTRIPADYLWYAVLSWNAGRAVRP